MIPEPDNKNRRDIYTPSPNFDEPDFRKAIKNKGQEVRYEKAIKCPCRSKASNQLSNCLNCGGSGWVYINPIEDRMLIRSINLQTQYKEWSMERLGEVGVTCSADYKLTFMDRITVLNVESTLSDVIHLKEFDGNVFGAVVYDIQEINYIAKFSDPSSKLSVLSEDDYTIDQNAIIIQNSAIINEFNQTGDVSLAVRYKYQPQYHVLDVPRETFVMFEQQDGRENEQDLPVNAIARRSHYNLGEAGTDPFGSVFLLDNSTE